MRASEFGVPDAQSIEAHALGRSLKRRQGFCERGRNRRRRRNRERIKLSCRGRDAAHRRAPRTEPGLCEANGYGELAGLVTLGALWG